MLQGITNRLPAELVGAIHQAVYLGTTYALLSLLASCLGGLLDFHAGAVRELGRSSI